MQTFTEFIFILSAEKNASQGETQFCPRWRAHRGTAADRLVSILVYYSRSRLAGIPAVFSFRLEF